MTYKVYIESLNNFPINDCGVSALQGFRDNQMDIIFFEDIEEVPTSKFNIVVGCIETTNKYFSRFDIPPKQALNIPPELRAYAGRYYQTMSMGEFRAHVARIGKTEPNFLPVFIKPDGRAKEFIAGVMTKPETIGAFKDVPDSSPVMLSDVIDIKSEWRCYIINGVIKGVKHYSGDMWTIPNAARAEAMVKDYVTQPSAYSLDLGVLSDGRTVLIECNDGWSLGNYGLEHTIYAKLLATRWREIFKGV